MSSSSPVSNVPLLTALPLRRSPGMTPEEGIRHALAVARSHLGMPVAFVSQFREGRRWFRYVDADQGDATLCEGGSDPLEDSYCAKIASGDLPSLMVDVKDNPVACNMPVTHAISIGSHISVPIVFSDGSLYGTFCSFAHSVDRSLVDRDVAVMRMLANLVGDYLEEEVTRQTRRSETLTRVNRALEPGMVQMHFQPIVEVLGRRVVGYEALSRFGDGRSPSIWFKEAAEVDFSARLEQRALKLALDRSALAPGSSYVAVNLSPDALLADGTMGLLLSSRNIDRIVVELTEHVAVTDYRPLARALGRLRKRGARLAIDDTGAGYSSLCHILELHPDLIKLDMKLTQNLGGDLARQSMIEALTRFALHSGARIVAEGIETEANAQLLSSLGVTYGQGWLYGRAAAEFMTVDQSPA